MTTDPTEENQTLGKIHDRNKYRNVDQRNDQMRLFEVITTPSRSRTATAISETAAAMCTDYDWIIRDMPRSWRLELSASVSDEATKSTFRSVSKVQAVHGALLRQLYGLAAGHFSILSLPTALVKGPTSVSWVFMDREINGELAGETSIEKRLFNFAMKETVRLYLAGIENWPKLECPTCGKAPVDPWSENLWNNDVHTLTNAFETLIAPSRDKTRQLEKAKRT